MVIWKIHGMCYREMAEAAELLAELAQKGELYGESYDLDSLEIHFNEHTGDVYLADGEGHMSMEVEDE